MQRLTHGNGLWCSPEAQRSTVATALLVFHPITRLHLLGHS